MTVTHHHNATSGGLPAPSGRRIGGLPTIGSSPAAASAVPSAVAGTAMHAASATATAVPVQSTVATRTLSPRQVAVGSGTTAAAVATTHAGVAARASVVHHGSGAAAPVPAHASPVVNTAPQRRARDFSSPRPAGPHDASRPLFGADALRVLVAENASNRGDADAEPTKPHGVVHIRRGSGGGDGGSRVLEDPLARARAARVAGPAHRRAFSRGDDAPSSPLASSPPAGSPPPASETWSAPTVPQARVGFDGPPVEGVMRSRVALEPTPIESGVEPSSGASTVVNPTTRRYLQRWAQQNLGLGGARNDDDLDIIDDFDEDFDF